MRSPPTLPPPQNLERALGLVMSEPWQLFLYANLMVFPGLSVA